VTGLIDYGSVKPDHVGVDLARLLGSLIEDDAALRGRGLDAYHAVRPLTPAERDLIIVLDRTGTVAALVNWLRWLTSGERALTPRASERLGRLVRRAQGWTSIVP
jgi:Ser/Thr protein kinase RdoA (MazF antagonist)